MISMRTSTSLIALATCMLAGAASAASVPFDSASISGLGARNIGATAMSGRIAAIAGRVEAGGKTMLLIGAASGGVWKSTDGGTTFRPIFDKETAQSIGALALDPSHPDTYWAGTGESWMRNSVSVGDGVAKTTEGGETWINLGLPNSEHISQVVVDPGNGDVVYACVPGRLWSDSADRGLYKTTDGGKTWSQIVKGANLSTGCSTIAMDPEEPGASSSPAYGISGAPAGGSRSGGSGPDQPSGSDLMVSVRTAAQPGVR